MKILSFGLDQTILDLDSKLAKRARLYGGLLDEYVVLVPYKENKKVELIKLDLSKKIDQSIFPKNIDILYHLAAINGTELFYKIPYEVATVNLSMTMNLLKYLEKNPVKKLIFSSTSEVYAGGYDMGLVQIPTTENTPVVFPQPTDVRFSYGTSKFMSEFLFLQFGEKYKIPITIIRFHNIYGPRMGIKHVVPELIMRLNDGESPLKVYGTNETRAFCYISDAIEAILTVALTEDINQEIIHIGNQNEEITIENLANNIIDLMNVNVNIEKSPGRSSSVLRRCPNTQKLFDKTGFKAKVGITEGLSKTIKWYLKNGI